MPQVFSRTADTVLRSSFLVALVFGIALAFGLPTYLRSPYRTGVGDSIEQPLPFSHAHHVGGLGLDCRYCHSEVERSSYAGMPSLETCMHCHSQVWSDSPVLAPLRDHFASGRPLVWQQVASVPDHVYFDHSIHVNKGVGCVECHGRVDRMEQTERAVALTMGYCLDCHHDPAPRLRPLDRVEDMEWRPSGSARDQGNALAAAYHLRPSSALVDCWTCHR